jgi:NAD kinase
MPPSNRSETVLNEAVTGQKRTVRHPDKTKTRPRIVFVTRETDFELLLARHATKEQVRFFLQTRGQDFDEVAGQHRRFYDTLKTAREAVPDDWRSAAVRRSGLDRFLFAEDDIVATVGQDGLVANVAKYLDAQLVIGINPSPETYDGVLASFPPNGLHDVFVRAARGDVDVQRRTMVRVQLDDGQTLIGLNEIFIGHRSHQSARYELNDQQNSEFQSSSGVVVTSGTGATGWARSIMESVGLDISLEPEEAAIAYLVREPFPSVATGTTMRARKCVGGQNIKVVSRMNDGGVIFADGIEQDCLRFDWGRIAEAGLAERRLHLVNA